MAIQIIGNSGTVANVDGTTFRALKITARPVDYGLLGQYKLSLDGGSGLVGGAQTSYFTARWTSTLALALVWYVRLDGLSLLSGTPTAAAFQNLSLSFARSYTASGTGGTAATLPGATLNNQKVRTRMLGTLMADVRMSSSTSAVVAGTLTADAQPLAQIGFGTPGAVAQTSNLILRNVLLYGQMEMGVNAMPIVLAQNEGIVTSGALNSITGVTVFMGYTMSWSEVAFF